MEQKNINTSSGKDVRMEAFIRGSINFSRPDGEAVKEVPQKKEALLSPKTRNFHEKLSSFIEPNLPAKELTSLIVRAALETEFGKSFTSNKNLDKMIEKIADAVMVNPALRKQSLAAASAILAEKVDQRKKN